ncbi:DUF4430 domain-containing protein [Paenibacillus pasadenensis]|uniref:DUF4430 domain-containing protein n=1 Tax=Paenibacillus pasadenensis TaxID=217090 RepID=UPI00203C0D3C|nr:DUF4430 domain-containing protein [Paenibacillus pasadenensis]MCM3749709.1 DUF4430 domain-containing protein [Paenibacillus pasadenensis]
MKMSVKKWIALFGIAVLLAAAFFFDGSGGPRSGQPAGGKSELAASKEITPGPTATVSPESTSEQKSAPSVTPGRTASDPSPAATNSSGQKEQKQSPPPGKGNPQPSGEKKNAQHPGKASSDSTTPTVTPPPKKANTGAGSGSKSTPKPDNPKPSGKGSAETQLTAALSVTAVAILDNLDHFNEDKLELVPKDGIIYSAQKVTFKKGESVFDVLLREMKRSKIHLEFEMSPIYNSNYIEGIHNIYEFDCGELSGWMYKVNGEFPNYGSSRYELKNGDRIEWVYTCDLGRDVGAEQASSEGER